MICNIKSAVIITWLVLCYLEEPEQTIWMSRWPYLKWAELHTKPASSFLLSLTEFNEMFLEYPFTVDWQA